MKIDKTKLYLIEWIDSHSMYHGWEYVSDIEAPKGMVCMSVGWIIKETKDNVMIIPHIADIKNKETDGQVCGAMVIPIVAIIKRTELITKDDYPIYEAKERAQEYLDTKRQ